MVRHDDTGRYGLGARPESVGRSPERDFWAKSSTLGTEPFYVSLSFPLAAKTPIPLPRASLSFLVKQPGGLGYSKCSKCSSVWLVFVMVGMDISFKNFL